MALALDTLAYARRLREAGFSEQQADGQAAALGALMTDELASKQDLRELATQMNGRFAQIEVRFETLERHIDKRLVELERRFEIRLDGRLAHLEQRMTIRLGAILVAAIAAAEALARLS